jgi:uncharacterized cupredoxin-like copper-binding protein
MRRWTVLAVAVPLVIAVAGCGSSKHSTASTSSSSSGGGAYSPPAQTSTTSSTAGKAAGSAVKLAADESGGLYFNKKTLSAKAGTVTIAMMNPKSSGTMHGIAVEGNGVDKNGKIVAAGSTSTLAVSLKPGKYTFYCPVPGHRQAGMQGTLTVQ